jgi:hypothetical protein
MALSACPGASVLRSTGRGRGRVTFERGFARRIAQWETEVELRVPAVCAAFVGGCAGIEATVRASTPDAACATEATGDCRCAARRNGGFSDADAYTTTATQIVSGTGGRRWDYCITGDRLRYRDASAAEPREPGQIELVRRAR